MTPVVFTGDTRRTSPEALLPKQKRARFLAPFLLPISHFLLSYCYEITGFGFSGLIARSLIAFCTVASPTNPS